MNARFQRYLRNFAAALLAGPWTPPGMRARAVAACGKPEWLRKVLRGCRKQFPTAPAENDLVAYLAAHPEMAELAASELIISKYYWHAPTMQPPRVPVADVLPPLPTTAAVAEWLSVAASHLAWYADRKGLNHRQPRDILRHYTFRWIPKRSGGARLLEAPRPVLKKIQRRILREILNPLAPHAAAHGFRRGRSIVTNAEAHCGRTIVLSFDLADFFPSVGPGRVWGIFRALGYPADVAMTLTALCTTRMPMAVWNARPGPADGSDHASGLRLRDSHLPQGAPTSPNLANLAAYRLDLRMTALAATVGATYTRYADDLTFSGGDDLAAASARIRRAVVEIAHDEGFAINAKKTRAASRGRRQTVTGVVVNVRPNLPRAEFDRLKAILTNCGRHGSAGQNRDGHPEFQAFLRGKVAHAAMVNPARGRRLWVLFDRIVWPEV